MDSPFWIYAVGLAAQVFYTGRLLIQWYLSEKHKRVESPTLFWMFSLIGSVLMFFAFAGVMYMTRNIDWGGLGKKEGVAAA